MRNIFRSLLYCLFIAGLQLFIVVDGLAVIDTAHVIALLNSDSAHRMHPSFVVGKIAESVTDTAMARQIILKIDEEGYQLRNLGNYQKALFFHQTALSLAYRFNLLDLQARIYNNLGVVYRRMDDYEPALHYHLLALKMAEMSGSKRSVAIALNSIGNINYMMGKYDMALKYFYRGYAMEKQDNRLRGMAINLNNIGNVYKSKGDTLMALKLYKQSLLLNEKVQDIKGMGICHNDLGMIYLAQGKVKLAEASFLKAYDYFKQTNDLRYIAEVSRNLGEALLKQKKLKEAGEYLLKSWNIARQLEAKWEEEASARALAEFYHLAGDHQNAYHYSTIAHLLRDKINMETAQKNISNAQAVYMLEKTEKEKEFYQNLSQLSSQKLKREKQLRIITSLIVFIGLLAVLLILYFRRRYTRRLKEKNRQLQEARDELKEYARKLEVALEKSEASARAKSIFLANISHEFRTPLNAIIGFSSLLRSRSDDKESMEMLDIVINSANNLIDLISDLLNISAIEAGQLELKQKSVNIKHLLRETESIFKLEAKQKSLEFILEISPEVPDFIISDEGRLRQVLFNLMGNALKFTEKGRIEIKAYCESLHGNGTKDFIIKIKDTGPGIPVEEQSQIFEPFFQGKLQPSDARGMGLGLSIVKKIMDMLGGTIELHSEVGKGSEFLLNFKNIREVKIIKEPAAVSSIETNNLTRGIQALVVDDLEVNRMLLARFLEDTGIDVLYASNGGEAIERAKLYRPAIAFIDIRMPGMDGFECARRLRQMPETRNTILIAVTASLFGKDLEALAGPPFDAYLLKPVEYNSFQRLVKNYNHTDGNS